MAKTTKIQWADATWNPFIGCSKVSPACDNCYAEGWAKRAGRDFSKVVRAATGTFHAPLTWKEPKRIFVCSLSDFFHVDILRADRHNAIKVMRDAPQHTYMLLTKRPENIKPQLAGTAWAEALPPNVWVGVTAENQEQIKKRVPYLLDIPARVRFLSCEPLLELISLRGNWETFGEDAFMEGAINWVIVGGESGPSARPMHPEWARRLRDHCVDAGVPFMFKQWGEWEALYEPHKREEIPALKRNERWLNIEGGHGFHGEDVWRMEKVGKAAAGRLLDGVEHNGVPA